MLLRRQQQQYWVQKLQHLFLEKMQLKCCVEGLPKYKQNQVEYYDSSNTFEFGSHEKFKSLFRAKILAKTGNNYIFIVTDALESTRPLLLSKFAEKTQTQIWISRVLQ